ncbi:glycosyl hydrolase family 18 protein [Desertivirga xinjiangensis]|uniref:glycosyl hydrolase family 18 protein n=1 Tax=Desertivirga xinjiangensis TaxID=539206 RepID=UPI002108E079|nr:glycosyl hydrolase family 18 protein [Pedobacter xinjiangensis]
MNHKQIARKFLFAFYLLVILPLISTASCKKNNLNADDKEKKESFRIIGYFKGDLVQDLSRVNFSAMTHVNIAFLNPDSTGKFEAVSGLKEFVTKAHQHKVKVLVSLGGGKAPGYYKTLISAEQRSMFIEQIKSFALKYKLDGIDVDLEGGMITADYPLFIAGLSQAIKPTMLLTAAIATEYGKQVPQQALELLDFVNIMAYDKTGPWRPSKPGQHSPYEMVVEDFEYWHTVRGLAKQKLNMGLPFYGYSFNGDKTGSFTYNRLITDYPGAEYKDEFQMKDGAMVYYNGISTIRKKTAFALMNTGGVMIWQILQDANGDKSLLTLIKDIVETAAANSKK